MNLELILSLTGLEVQNLIKAYLPNLFAQYPADTPPIIPPIQKIETVAAHSTVSIVQFDGLSQFKDSLYLLWYVWL
jgi:hypothetical protein